MEFFTNEKKHPTYVGSRLVQPGETILLDTGVSVVVEQVAAPAGPAGSELDAVLSQSVADIKALLPAMSVAELEQLLAAEQAAAKPRSTLISEIDASILALKAQ